MSEVHFTADEHFTDCSLPLGVSSSGPSHQTTCLRGHLILKDLKQFTHGKFTCHVVLCIYYHIHAPLKKDLKNPSPVKQGEHYFF